MLLSSLNIDKKDLDKERQKGTSLSITFRWVFILIAGTLLLIQYSAGYREISKHALTLIFIYSISNIVFWLAAKRGYNPRYMGFIGAFIDIVAICYHLYGMTIYFDHTSATAAATTFLIPVIYLIYTFRLDRGLMFFLIGISIAGFNVVYFSQYLEAPGLFSENISLSPISHIFKSVYLIFIGLLCIYMQSSIFRFIQKQLSEKEKKAQLDSEILIEQEKTRSAKEMIEKEKALNKELENEIRKKDELAAKLKDNKEQIKSIISNLLGFTYRCKPDDSWTMLFISDQVEDVAGYNPSSVINNEEITYKSLIHPDDMSYVDEHLTKALGNRRQFELEYRIRHKNGNDVWVHESGRGVYDKEGSIVYIDGIITDISAKKEAETRLKETRGLVKTLISNLVGAVSRCLFDEHYTTLYYSEKIFDITGYRAKDFIGNRNVRFSDLILKEDREDVKKEIENCVINKKPYSIEFRIIHKNGNIIWVQENGSPVYDDEGELLYLDGITTEITGRKLAEQELINAKLKLEELNEKLGKTVEERTARLTEANTQLLKLQKENLQSQFEVLKQQVNPHFLFNSLNVLTSLIKADPDLAEAFTERLSKVYRHVLENKDKDLVTLATEMNFIKAYVFLLDIRFAKKVFVRINIDDKDLDAFVVPLALQLLIENAIKHNTFSRKNPLTIEIFIDNNRFLNIINNLQNRKLQMTSTGVGLVNISKRYSLLSEKQPVFEMTDSQFIAKIPLISREQ